MGKLRKYLPELFTCLALILVGAMGYYILNQPVPVEAKAVKIAIIDSARIKTHSIPFVKVGELLAEQHNFAHQEILQEEIKLRELDEKLKDSKKPDEEKKELDKKIAELEQYVQKKQEKLNNQFSLITQMLEKELRSVIEEIAKEYGFNLVLNMVIRETQAILYADKSFDITEETIKRLDRKIPTICLPEIGS